MFVFRCLELAWKFQTQIAFQQWNRGSSWNKKLTSAFIWTRSMSESHWWYLFHKAVKSWDSTTWFRIWRFQTLGFKSVSSKASSGWTIGFFFFFFFDDDRGFLRERLTNLMAPKLPPNSPSLFCLHISTQRSRRAFVIVKHGWEMVNS